MSLRHGAGFLCDPEGKREGREVYANTTEKKIPIYIAFYCVALVLCRGEDVPPSFG
jgi:hypothetical protein